MGNDHFSREKKGLVMTDDGIPTVNLNDAQPAKRAAKKSKRKAAKKPKAKAKKPTRKAPKAKTSSKTRLDQVPAELAPPRMDVTEPKVPPPAQQQAAEPVQEVTDEQVPESAPAPVATKPAPVIHDPTDTRLVQGATCTWIGTMGEAPDNDQSVPVCPHCSGHLLTVAGGEETMALGFEAYELGAYTSVNPAPRPHPGYKGFMNWIRAQARERCWTSLEVAAAAYQEETGVRVDPTR